MEPFHNRKTLHPSRRQFIQTLAIGASLTTPPPRTRLTADADDDYPDLEHLQGVHRKKGMIAPDKTYRMMEWEFHTPPEANFNHINVPAAVRAAQDAGAEGLFFYTQGCWGYANYPTQVGVRHPNLHYDLFGEEIKVAHERGLSVLAYYCLQFNNQAVMAHPDWAWVNAKGEPIRVRWYQTCLDTPYRHYALRMLDEICSHYEFEELFIDAYGRQINAYHSGEINDPFCYCKYTEEAWNREHPGDPYREGMKTAEGWEKRYRWLVKRATLDMIDEINHTARKHRPNLIIAVNGGPIRQDAALMPRVTYLYGEPVASPTGIALGTIVERGWGRPYYQSGVFTQEGYIDIYPGTIPRVQADALAVQNTRTAFVGNAPIINGLDGEGFSKRWFQVAKETWENLRNVDCLLGPELQPLYSTVMLYSLSTRSNLEIQKRPTDFRQSVAGALETLTYAGRPVESLPDFRLTPEILSGFETLVLPEVEVLSDVHAQVIRDWVKQGGTLVASYKCGLLNEKRQPRSNFPLADVLGVDFISEERKYAYDAEGQLRPGDFTSTYLESAGHRLARPLAVSTVGLPGAFLRLKRTTAEEVMRYRLPFMVQDLKKNEWFNWGPPPPGSETAGTAVAYNKFGKGQSLYLGVPIFWAMNWHPLWIQEWIPLVMRQLVPEAIAELRPEPFSEYVHGTFFYDQSKRFILVQALNTVALATQEETRSAPDVVLRINPRKLKVTGARMVWPKKRDLTVTTESGKTRITLKTPERYTALFLKLA